MANVMFKRGLSTKLPTGSNIVDGAFYLTTDTNHLYIGKDVDGTKSLAKINGNIHSVTSLPTTGEAGEFYYLPGQNILAYYDNGKWVQLNPDTNTDTSVESIAIQKNTNESNDSKLVYDVVLKQKNIKGEVDTQNPITTSFEISSADVTGIVTQTAVSVDATVDTENNKVTIKNTGAGSAGSGFTITGGNNVIIGGSDNALTISAVDNDTTYELLSPANSSSIVLKAKGGKEEAITLVAGNQIAISGTTARQIQISHGDITVDKDGHIPKDATELSHESEFVVVNGITQDDNGHVTGYSTQKYKLPVDNDTKNDSIAVSATGEGNLSITIKDTKGGEKTGTLSNGLYYKVNGATIYNQADLANAEYFVQLREDIDALAKDLSGIDALRYRGTVGVNGTVSALPITNVQLGDTYKVNTEGEYASITCVVGDLLIATGVEGVDGYISSGSLEWTHVAQGSDTDTTYTLTGASNKITLTASTGGAGDITVEGGTDITTNVINNKLTVTHDNITRTDDVATTEKALSHGDIIDVVTGADSSDTGHITGITVTKYKLPTDNNTTYTLPAAQVTADTHSKITLTAGGTGGGADDVVNFKANRANNTSLKVSGSGDTITYEHTTYTYTNPDTTEAGTLAHGGKLQVVTGAQVNNGHITGLTTTEYTLPTDNNTTYTLSGKVSADTATGKTSAIKIVDTLLAGGTGAGAETTSMHKVTSNTLTLTAETDGYNVDLVWGTF